jgi:hypothetical protein
MKLTRSIVLILAVCFLSNTFTSCKKKVTGPNTVWIGSWYCEDGTERVTIAANGAGSWEFYENGVTKTIEGKVKFESGSFKIKALFFKKEFTIKLEPTSCDVPNGGTVDPSIPSSSYNCIYAKLNGKEFLKL